MKPTRSERFLAPINRIMSGHGRRDDISYGPHPAMVYDEFPSRNPSAPIVMFWHGGGWTTGNKMMYRFMGHMLQKLGAHALVVGHPLYSEQTFPGFIDDAELAIDHVRRRFPGRPIFTMGHSAGAHTALIVAMKRRDDPIDGVISIAAPCTLSQRYWVHVFGETFRDGLHDPRTYIANSPVRTRYMLIHGGLDYTVVLADGISLNRRLQKAGYMSRLYVLKLADHFTILPLLAFGPLFATRRRLKRFIFANSTERATIANV